METIFNNAVIWLGTAEVNHKLKGEIANDSLRVRAALVKTPGNQTEKVLIEWEGRWIPEHHATFSREYEDAATKNLIENVNPDIAARIDAALTRSRK